MKVTSIIPEMQSFCGKYCEGVSDPSAKAKIIEASQQPQQLPEA